MDTRDLGSDLLPLHFSAFHPSYRMMDVPPTPHETLTCARAIALAEGLHYVYAGNVHDREGDTHCPNPQCQKAKLIELTGTALSPTAYQQAPSAVTARNVAPQSPGDGDERLFSQRMALPRVVLSQRTVRMPRLRMKWNL